jgi:hypothetical protein
MALILIPTVAISTIPETNPALKTPPATNQLYEAYKISAVQKNFIKDPMCF